MLFERRQRLAGIFSPPSSRKKVVAGAYVFLQKIEVAHPIDDKMRARSVVSRHGRPDNSRQTCFDSSTLLARSSCSNKKRPWIWQPSIPHKEDLTDEASANNEGTCSPHPQYRSPRPFSRSMRERWLAKSYK